jgi:spermidine synthase
VINRDGNLRLQYMAGLALNTSMEAAIYNTILNYRRFPRNLFTGTPEKLEALRVSMESLANQ